MASDVIKGGFSQNPEFEEAVRRARKRINADSPFVIMYLTELNMAILDVSIMNNPRLCHFSAMLQYQVTALFDDVLLDE